MNKVTNLEAARSWIDSESKYEDSTNNVLQKFHFLFKHGNKEEQEVKLKVSILRNDIFHLYKKYKTSRVVSKKIDKIENFVVLLLLP